MHLAKSIDSCNINKCNESQLMNSPVELDPQGGQCKTLPEHGGSGGAGLPLSRTLTTGSLAAPSHRDKHRTAPTVQAGEATGSWNEKAPQTPGTAQGGSQGSPILPSALPKCSTPTGTPLGGLGECGMTGRECWAWGLAGGCIPRGLRGLPAAGTCSRAPTSSPTAAPGYGLRSLLQPKNVDPKRWEEEEEQERKGKERTPVIKLKASSWELVGARDARTLRF